MKKFPSLFSSPKNKKFAFTPRYFDPEKEEREQRIAMIEREVKGESGRSVNGYQYRISQGFRKKKVATERNPVFIRLFVVVLLLTIFYLVFS